MQGVWTTQWLSYFEFRGGGIIQDITINNKNFELLTRIKVFKLFSKKAIYYDSCRKSFIRNPLAWRSSNRLPIDNQNKTEEAHRTVFGSVQEVSDRDIVFDVIVQLSYLTKDYTGSLSTTDFISNNYCPEKLKSKIGNCSTYKSSVSFAKPT